MKTLIATVIAASLGFAYPAFAEDAHHPEQQGAVAAQPTAKTTEQSVKKMQENVKMMQGQLDRIGKAKTDEERQKAVTEHMKTMQENMMMARSIQAGMMGCPMMYGGTMGGGMMGQGGMGMMSGMGGGPASGADRMQYMERRMDMMQMMMEQMLSRPEGMPPAAPAK